MNDALNLIALAKMAVIVIGIFMVPIITRKFAADLGAPVGQMAMNRAAIAGAGLGYAGAKLAWAATQSARSSAAASVLTSAGSKIKSAGSSLLKSSHQITEEGAGVSSNGVSSKVGKKLEKFGQYLEDASVRHDAKKVGIAPPSLVDKVKKTLSTDPQVTGPIVAKEQRYQAFLNSRSRQSPPSALADNSILPNQQRASFHSSASALSSSGSGSIVNPSISASPRATTSPSTPRSVSTDRLAPSPNAQTEVTRSSPSNQTLTSRIQQIRHRWKDGKRINKLFETPNERKPS